MATTKDKTKSRAADAVGLNKLLALLNEIDKRIIDIDKASIRASSSSRGLFLEGKSSGLNEAYRMIKQRFHIK